jgi:hypothetical protein
MDSLQVVDLVVPDFRLANLLKQCFLPDAQVAQITHAPLLDGDKGGRPRIHASDAQRKRSERAEEISKLIEELDALHESGKHLKNKGVKRTRDPSDISIGARGGSAFNQESPRVFPRQFYGKQEAALPLATESMSHAEFIEFLKICHELALDLKVDNQLVSAAYFDPAKSTETNRGLGNIVHLNAIWLDNDGEGDLTVETFIAMFPRWEMYICKRKGRQAEMAGLYPVATSDERERTQTHHPDYQNKVGR